MRTLVTVNNAHLKKLIFQPAMIRRLSALSDVDWVDEGKRYTVEDLQRDIGRYEICITSWGSPKLTRDVLARAEKLRFVGHAAGSITAYMDEHIFDRDIVVVNANAALANSTAESALAMILSGAWDLFGLHNTMLHGSWPDHTQVTVTGLQNRIIGIIGLGEISRELIRLLRPFQLDILLYSRHCSHEEAGRLGVRLAQLDELLANSDYITLHNTLTPSTVGMLGIRELRLIKEGAILINTARGPIIRESDLIEALREGRFKAILDVYDTEPLPPDHALFKLPNVICYPHIGGFSAHYKSMIGELIVNDLERWINNEPLQGLITRDKYSRLSVR